MSQATNRSTKNQRRAAARERARKAMAEAKRRERRTTILVRSGFVTGIVVVLAVIALVVVSGIKPSGPGPRNMASDGIVIGKSLVAERTGALEAGEKPVPTPTKRSSATADIRLYTDFQCPACGAFEKENGDYIQDLVEKGAATAELHPVAILDRASLGSKYSTRSASAAACVADLSPDSFFDFDKALFARQPAENTRGLSNDEIMTVAHGVKGLKNAKKIDTCIDDQRFASWVTDATKRALAGPLPGTDVKKLEVTPTVTVNGAQFDGTKQTFTEFVATQLGKADDSRTGGKKANDEQAKR
ncbi:hypothetical protein AX769_02515 [Frondihabitans sp. PAMC 28766]|uniref:DsbA family protein n=1 Tax=Frondihabitans sp. PAMC 28766 TaxID=1795630 RepID=UPI00078D3A41|nr:thioredoxin domain-containing protein [Frondihabitans sp. PAMC 28766]AMM19211.1 hypothetical protein AX769_02515 [Frondihabitans sp. PAMC 28766]